MSLVRLVWSSGYLAVADIRSKFLLVVFVVVVVA